tara:strand:+ start:2715 stop:3974 length:1260 start_codon:yes stop_codon:yes gene_type:complete
MAIKNFSQYLIEAEREVFFTFGRMNPPTIGHGKVFDELAKKSGKNDYKVFLSQVSNPKKDPLSYSDKVKHVRKMFPKHGRSVIINKGVRTAFDAIVELYDQGYRKVNMVVGSDRVREFDTILKKYNGVKGRHGFYNFENINVVSAGERDPDAEGVTGMSASKQRTNAKDNDYTAFSQGVPSTMNDKDTRKLFNDVRKGMGLTEEKQFKRHVDLGKLNEMRENYVKGGLYEIGDTVVIKSTEEVGIVSVLGSNYVVVETKDRKLRKWLQDIEIVEKSLTPAEIKKRDEIKKAMEKDNPNMDKSKKIAIATATAKRVAETIIHDIDALLEREMKKEKEAPKEVPQDPDADEVKGTQPKKYYKGIAKKNKISRAKHFNRGSGKDDDDPSAYKDAPGDKKAREAGKLKPSKHTKKFKQMFGDD